MRRHLLAIVVMTLACEGPAGDYGRVSLADAPQLSGQEIAEHMRILSSDDFFGRGPGHVGGDLAADYIAAYFEEVGLDAPGESFFQTVPMVGTTPSRSIMIGASRSKVF